MHRAIHTLPLLLWATAPARATWSVVATDAETREIGGAATTCLGDVSLRIVYGSAPGHGVIHAQAQLGIAARDRAVPLLAADTDPEEIIAIITDPAFDPSAQRRQYGIVDLMGRAAGFTGTDTIDYAEARPGSIGRYTYSVQGNILTSVAVIDQSETAFRAGGCDLADRLMRSLEAGAIGGEGDSRCTSRGYPSDTAFLQVDREGEPSGSFVLLEARDTAPESAVVALRREYDAWRATSPCPAAAPDAATSLDAAVAVDAAISFDAAVAADGASSGDASPADARSALDAAATAPPTAGCGCATTGRRGPLDAVLVLALLAPLVRARARVRSRAARDRRLGAASRSSRRSDRPHDALSTPGRCGSLSTPRGSCRGRGGTCG
jgi:uncharacterized Ntn-hydrolase superfamily protein